MTGKCFNYNKDKIVKIPKKVLDFLDEIDDVCKKHGLIIVPEDSCGYVIERYWEKHKEFMANNLLLNIKGE